MVQSIKIHSLVLGKGKLKLRGDTAIIFSHEIKSSHDM